MWNSKSRGWLSKRWWFDLSRKINCNLKTMHTFQKMGGNWESLGNSCWASSCIRCTHFSTNCIVSLSSNNKSFWRIFGCGSCQTSRSDRCFDFYDKNILVYTSLGGGIFSTFICIVGEVCTISTVTKSRSISGEDRACIAEINVQIRITR